LQIPKKEPAPALWQWLLAGMLTAFVAQETAAQEKAPKHKPQNIIQNDSTSKIQHPQSKATPNEWSIKGTVRDPDLDFPLPGVTIHIDKTQTGTLTDSVGNFFLKLSPQNFSQSDSIVLLVRYVGYHTQELHIAKQELPKVLDIELKESCISTESFIQINSSRVLGGAAFVSYKVNYNSPWQRIKSFFRRLFKKP
jgi:hypothetical protein